MFIHLIEGSKKYDAGISEDGFQQIQDDVMNFENNTTVTVADVVKKLQHKVVNSTIYLYDEHGSLLQNNSEVEHARVYTIRRKPIGYANRELLIEKYWALLDIEFIRTSSTHQCIRKLYILEKNGYTDMELEFYPCQRYSELVIKYQKSFRFCRAHIYKLNYEPKKYSLECSRVLPVLNEYIVNSGIEVILYKGGTLERDLCKALDIPSLNIECFDKLEKVLSHDPRGEVNNYYNQVKEFL